MTTDMLDVSSSAADLDDVPLALMPSLGLGVLGMVIGRVLPDPLVDAVRTGGFQSSV